MFGIGSTEFLVIVLVGLLVLGPKNLAKVLRTVGKYVGEFRRISTEFQRTLNVEAAEEERQEKKEAIRQKAAKAKEKFAQKQAARDAAEPAQASKADTASAANGAAGDGRGEKA